MTIRDYKYTGNVVTYKAVSSSLHVIECWGAQGGSDAYGGKGAYTKAEIFLNRDDVLYIYVGGQGTGNASENTSGGWNGGGAAGTGRGYGIAYGGGGASDVRFGGNTLNDRIVVAAGGGGGQDFGSNSSLAYGGYGGSVTKSGGAGTMWCCGNPGSGATQSSGGAGGVARINATANGTSGTFGAGGRGTSAPRYQGGCGGGGGWYGGGGASDGCGGPAGGGGSSYVNTSKCNQAFVSLPGNANFKSPTGEEATGNSGNGFIRISDNATDTFEYTGKEQQFIVPENGVYLLESYGAAGGSGGVESATTANGYKFLHPDGCSYAGQTHYSTNQTTCTQCSHSCGGPGVIQYGGTTYYGSIGGKGGYRSGEIFLRKGDIITVNVGGKGSAATNSNGGAGWNGGGAGKNGNGKTGYGGGGATDFRLNGNSLSDRILVAGGGGGADDYDGNVINSAQDGSGGNGSGASIGGEPKIDGVIQENYGAKAVTGFTLGFGENASGTGDLAGGGGGWYGGKATNHNSGGAGGGNGYSIPRVKGVKTNSGVNSGNGVASISLVTPLMNVQYYVVELNGELYIPSSKFYDHVSEKFTPLPQGVVFDNSASKDGFILNISDLFRETVINGKKIIPITQFKGGRILKVTANIPKLSNNYDKKHLKLDIKLDFKYEDYEKTTIEIKDKIVFPKNELAYYMSVNNIDGEKIKAGIEYRESLLGEYFKKIKEDEIRPYGIKRKNLESYDIPFNECKVFFKFIDSVADEKDNLKKLTIKKKVLEDMRVIGEDDVTIRHDVDKDIIFLEVLKQYKEILINKNNYKEIHHQDTLDEF